MVVDVVNVLKPQADRKEYRLTTLTNGLQALLIHDPKILEGKS
jgi:secreted Zn-dependent insulinase-like peptidase